MTFEWDADKNKTNIKKHGIRIISARLAEQEEIDEYYKNYEFNYEIPAEDLERLNGFNNTDFSDCPKDTAEQLKLYKPWYKLHPHGYGQQKAVIQTEIDDDLLVWLKQGEESYQLRLNAVLRWAKQNGCPMAALGNRSQSRRSGSD